MAEAQKPIGKLHDQRFHEDDRRRGFYDIVPGLKGDLNFTHVPAGSIAGLHLHKEQSDYFCVAKGAMLFRMITEDGKEERVVLSAYSRKTLIIPPGVWHGYKALEDSIVIFYIDQKFNTNDEHRKETKPEDWTSPIR